MSVLSKVAVVAGLALGGVAGMPWESASKMATHKVHNGARGLTYNTYHPAATYEVCLISNLWVFAADFWTVM